MLKKPLKDKKIQIYKHHQTTDSIGNQISEWLPLSDSPLWAYFRQIGGSEYYAAAASERVAEDVVFYINWRNDVDTSARVVYKDKEYNIVRIDPFEGYKSDLKLYCKLEPRPDIVGG